MHFKVAVIIYMYTFQKTFLAPLAMQDNQDNPLVLDVQGNTITKPISGSLFVARYFK